MALLARLEFHVIPSAVFITFRTVITFGRLSQTLQMIIFSNRTEQLWLSNSTWTTINSNTSSLGLGAINSKISKYFPASGLLRVHFGWRNFSTKPLLFDWTHLNWNHNSNQYLSKHWNKCWIKSLTDELLTPVALEISSNRFWTIESLANLMVYFLGLDDDIPFESRLKKYTSYSSLGFGRGRDRYTKGSKVTEI